VSDEVYERTRPVIGKLPEDFGRQFEHGGRWCVYFPGTDLCVTDMGAHGTGKPSRVEWVAAPEAAAEEGPK
jgi:hypothetical protein